MIDHLSYSSLNTFLSCPRSYYLSRVKKAEPRPAWYFVVGTTVHEAHRIKHESGLVPSPAQVEDLFNQEVLKHRALEPDTSKWMHGGSKDEPVVEERALKLALDCWDNLLVELDQIDIWHVEYDASGYLPGCTLPIKAYVDIIGEHKKHGPCIFDIKTGKTKPKAGDLQLPTYGALWSVLKGKPEISKGLYLMLNPGASKARPKALTMTPAEVGAQYHELELALQQKIARPEPQFNCKPFCTMFPNCKLQAGPTARALYYDTPEKDGWIPFD